MKCALGLFINYNQTEGLVSFCFFKYAYQRIYSLPPPPPQKKKIESF